MLFEEKLLPRYKDVINVQMRNTFRKVVDTTLITERNYLGTKKGIQSLSQPSSYSQPHLVANSRPQGTRFREGQRHDRRLRPQDSKN